jgi:hypothetical protein
VDNKKIDAQIRKTILLFVISKSHTFAHNHTLKTKIWKKFFIIRFFQQILNEICACALTKRFHSL